MSKLGQLAQSKSAIFLHVGHKATLPSYMFTLVVETLKVSSSGIIGRFHLGDGSGDRHCDIDLVMTSDYKIIVGTDTDRRVR